MTENSSIYFLISEVKETVKDEHYSSDKTVENKTF
jgi:hypothetical protein